jgi:hypothetical protein
VPPLPGKYVKFCGPGWLVPGYDGRRPGGVDRKTVRRYGRGRGGGRGPQRRAGQLSDEVIGAVVTGVRPVRPEGHGTAGSCTRSGADHDLGGT